MIHTVETWAPTATRRWLTIDERLMPYKDALFSVETHMSVEERQELLFKALNLPDQFVACEIGSYWGASTFILGAAATVKGGTVYAIDTWGNDAMGTEARQDTWEVFQRNTRDVIASIIPVRGFSTDVADRIPDDLDLVFIDGDHDFEPVLNDLLVFVPKIRMGGLLLMHDRNMVGVSRAIEEAKKHFVLVDYGYQIHELHSFRVYR